MKYEFLNYELQKKKKKARIIMKPFVAKIIRKLERFHLFQFEQVRGKGYMYQESFIEQNPTNDLQFSSSKGMNMVLLKKYSVCGYLEES